MQKIVTTKEFCSQGFYQIRLCHNGEWKTVVIDDRLPFDALSKQLAYSSASRKQLWVPLIEKALAKLNGCYESLTSGSIVEGLATITGFPCMSIQIELNQLEKIWAKLESSYEAGYLLATSCGRKDAPNEDFYTNKGLISSVK